MDNEAEKGNHAERRADGQRRKCGLTGRQDCGVRRREEGKWRRRQRAGGKDTGERWRSPAGSPTHTTLPSQGQAARDAALETWQLVALKFPRKAGDQVYKFKRRAALTLESKVTTMVTHTKKKPSHNRSIEYYYITE